MQIFTRLGLFLLLCALPLGALADNGSDNSASSDQNQGVVDEIAQYLKGQSIVLGLGYDQGTFKLNNSSAKVAQLTDNGRPAPIIDFVSAEHVLGSLPMKYGDAVLGLNFTGSFGEQNTNFQNVPGGSGILGQNIGSKVTGDYLAGAPVIYLRLGPVYPGTDSYWLFGYGLGGALWHFSGNPVLYIPGAATSTTATSTPISSRTKLVLYQTWRWQFHFNNWNVQFVGKGLGPLKVGGYDATYENYGIGIAYTIHF